MDRYVCTACGYVYDPAEGDPDGGIAPGTPFEDIPDDWVCRFAESERTCLRRNNGSSLIMKKE